MATEMLPPRAREVAGATPSNLGALVLGYAEQYGDSVAFQIRRGFRRDRVSYRQAGERSRRVAEWLLSRGLARGDRIVVWSANMPEYAVLYFGAWLAGVVVVPIDLRTRQEVVDRFVATARPRLGFTSRGINGTFGAPVEATFSLEDLFDVVASVAPLEELPHVGADDLAEIAFTSGTTGLPKGVMITHGNLLAETRALRAAFPLAPDDRALSLLPLSHAFELVVNLLLAFSYGVRMTYLPRVNGATVARAFQEERITCSAIVPELLRLLLSGIERQVRQQGSESRWRYAARVAPLLPFRLRRLLFWQVHRALGGELRFFGCGGAPLDPKVGRGWESMGVDVFEGYGMTETCAATTLNTRTAHRVGSVGRPVPGVELRIADDGEILVRGPTVTPGYYGNPELTRRSFAGGWLRTGDVGSLDADGFLHIAGRDAFKIVLADGRKVYAEDVEHALNEHPLVRESCVVGRQRPSGEEVHAVLLTDAPERAQEIVREANRTLAPHQQIAGFTIWSEPDFPRTPLLKVDRALVRRLVQPREKTAGPIRPPEAAAPADPLAGLLASVSGVRASSLSDDAELGSDLGLDSIARVELLSLIEEELGSAVDEMQVSPQTTVGELRALLEEGAGAGSPEPAARWPRTRLARAVGGALLKLAFRIQDYWMRVEIVHPERAASLPFPSILIFNYQGPHIPVTMLRAIPPHLRARVAVAVTARVFRKRDRWQGMLVALAVQGFPIATSDQSGLRRGLDEMGRWLDDGYAVIISPEGGPERDSRLRPFLDGTGLMAVEMQVPVIPFRVENYGRLFPPDPPFPYLPTRRGTFRLIIGEPITFPRGTPYHEATARLRQAFLDAE